jgi:putative ABC transport system permease protein
VRLALRASRGRLARLFIAEVLLLAAAGAGPGLAVAVYGTSLLVRLSPGGITRIAEAHVDGRVLVFAVLVAAVTSVLFGLAPAFSASGVDLADSLKQGGRGGVGSRSSRARRFLVIAEVALSLVLLVGAGLLVRTLAHLKEVPLGFEPRNVLTMTVAKSPTAAPEATAAFFQQLVARVKALPGVEDASVTWQLPLSGAGASTALNIEGRPDDPANVPTGIIHAAAPGYFRTMGIPIVKGRDFTDHDDMRSTRVLIVNEALARKYFPRGDALGKRIMPGYTTTGDYRQREIIGIVADVKHGGLTSTPSPEFYYSQSQMPVSTMTLVVRAVGNPNALVAPIRREVHELDATAPVFAVRTAEEYLARSTAPTRFNTFLVGAFALVALVLTVVGLYGVVAYSVSQATRDIGIRMALGARRADVLRLVLGQGLTLTLGGVGVGLLAALALTRVMSSLLFGVAATDALTFGGVAALLLIVAVIACYVPARRATRVDPIIAIRYE